MAEPEQRLPEKKTGVKQKRLTEGVLMASSPRQETNKTNDLQKKVSEAIANSLNAISKFKSTKNQAG